jgi:hypothetical protein
MRLHARTQVTGGQPSPLIRRGTGRISAILPGDFKSHIIGVGAKLFFSVRLLNACISSSAGLVSADPCVVQLLLTILRISCLSLYPDNRLLTLYCLSVLISRDGE